MWTPKIRIIGRCCHGQPGADAGRWLELLLQKGADIEAKDACGRTPLLYIAVKEHGTVVERLLSWAAPKGLETVVGPLVKKRPDVDSNCKNGLTPLSRTAGNEHEVIILSRG
jgi:ankyrin repeat protein